MVRGRLGRQEKRPERDVGTTLKTAAKAAIFGGVPTGT